jgi:ATP-binding cassette subfamily C protein CydC
MTFLRDLMPFLFRLKPHLHRMLAGTLSGAAALAASVGLLSLSGWFLSATALAGLTLAGAQAFNFFYPSVAVRLFAATRIIARYSERIITHETTFRILKTLRVWFYERIEPIAPACLSRFRSGDILNSLVSDIDALDNLYIRILSPAASALLIIVSTGVFLGFFDTVLSVASCGILFFAAVGVPWATAAAALVPGRNLGRIAGGLRTSIIESIQGLTDLIVFGTAEKRMEAIGESSRRMISLQRRLSRIRGLSNASISLLSGCAVWVVLWIGVSLVESGQMPGEFLACLALAVWASFESATPLTNAFHHFGRILEAAERITEITSTPPAVLFPEISQHGPDIFDIHFDDIRFQYHPDGPPVIDGLRLHIPQGWRTALVGETGCGKSTLVHLLTRAWDPAEGRIRIGGRDLRGFSEDGLRGMITVVSQQAHIFNDTIAENLRIGKPDAGESEMFDALEAVRLADFVHSLPESLQTWVGERGHCLSGGQARRLALARAVLHNAPVWVFDEPTEGLDTITEKEVVQSLIRRGHNRTMLMITHRLVELHRMDQIVFMDRGRIAACGPHPELVLSDARYRALVSRMA